MTGSGVGSLVVVAPRRSDGPVAWEVLAGPDGTGGLATVVHRWTTTAGATSGFAGPPMWPGGKVNWWRGSATGVPDFVLVRTLPVVARVSGWGPEATVIPIRLTDVDPRFGLRFGAAPLPADFRLLKLKAFYIDGTAVDIPVPGRPTD